MEFPAYQQRSDCVLERALQWAQRKLHLLDWTIWLWLDDAADRERHLDHDDATRGCSASYGGDLVTHIGIWREKCEAANEDPVHTLFHEVAHVALVPWYQLAKAQDLAIYTDDYEQNCNRFALLLYELWQIKEQG